MVAISFNIEADTRSMQRKLNNFAQSQVKWATVLTINETGLFLLNQNKKHMKRTFNKANAYTLNAFYFKRANKQNLMGVLQRKDKQSGKHYLEVQQTGGLRPRKAVESKMEYNLPYSGIIRSVTPTSRTGGRSGGNISMAWVNKVLDGKNKKGSVRYFTAGPHSLTKFGGGNKTGGVYRVMGKSNPEKLFHFHDHAMKYRPKFDFYGNVQRNFKAHYRMRFSANLKKAMATSKYALTTFG